MNIKEKLSVLGNVFFTHREMSTDETIYRLLSITLKKSNRKVTCMFLPTELQEQRTRLLKSEKELQSLPGDSVNIFQTSIVDRYAARPKTLENMCYADFASQYIKGSNTEQNNNLDGAVKVRNSKRQSITLQNKLGKMYRLIRFHATPRRKDPESYYHRTLMMYLPWRDHEELKFEGSYKKKLLMVSSQLVKKIEEYEGRLQELMDISVSEENIPQHVWDSLAAQTGQEKDDEAIFKPEHLDTSENPPEFDVTGSLKQNQPFSVEYSNIYIPLSQYKSMVQTLNERQRLVHDFIVDWCWKVK